MNDVASAVAPAQCSARFACEHCKAKKIKCSRELPKCSACKPWPGECVYPKDKPLKASKPNTFSVVPAEADPVPPEIGQRLARIENALLQLTTNINELLLKSSANEHQDILADQPFTCKHSCGPTPRSRDNDTDQLPLTVEEFHTFATLEQAEHDLQDLAQKMGSEKEQSHQAAATSLHELSKDLRTTRLYDQEMKSHNDDERAYFVPSKSEGYRFMGCVLEIMELADILTVKPSDEVLQAIIFRPETVKEAGWLVWINFLLLNFYLDEKPQPRASLIDNLRRNMQRALNNASVFLEPREINVQALMLLACHGEDYSSPNVSWMLMGHACRQAQALGLHIAKTKTASENQRRLSLFWSLFVMDKISSLAFGRPTLLPTGLYQDVPSPEFQHLRRYQPHRLGLTLLEESTFGAHFFRANIDLAKLAGLVLDFLCKITLSLEREALIEKVEAWGNKTRHALEAARESELCHATEHHAREMSLGIDAMRFQQLHILLLLSQGDQSYLSRKIETAREILALLSDLVSNSSHVYNGIVWQLLYYPFAAFVTVFNHVTTNPTLSSSEGDLRLLNGTVSYYHSMNGEMGSSSRTSLKLERTAILLYDLAFFIVDIYSTSHTSIPGMTSWTFRDQSPLNRPPFTLDSSGVNSLAYSDQFNDFIQTQCESAVNLSGEDIDTILGCLEGGETGNSRGRKRTFDSAFDWFAWDTAPFDSNAPFEDS
ncbi:unnamed protein product [Clonostachys rosea]|uniref:Zn(2)-C6 fungal-type domain-containing protein n=1 Tax=Bionectria ochroleuca TaxID=29856 RepID=A0ABY6UI11_BIOOC|nr:unnamed protein product [Clonostachys rosea]